MACSKPTATALSLVLVLFWSNLALTTSSCDSVFDPFYYIVHKVTGRIISGATSGGQDVSLQPVDTSYAASFYNTWEMYATPRPGLFFVTIKCCLFGVLGFNRTTSEVMLGEHTDSIYQQWFFNVDGRIINGGAFDYGLRVNRTGLGQFDLYVGPMEETTDDDVFEFVVSEWTRTSQVNVY